MTRPRTIMRSLAAALAMTTFATALVAAHAFPDRIELPDDFAPEGIATGRGSTFYTGSLAGAGIWQGDYRTGEGDLLVEGGGPFVGMKVDAHNRLWVAGGDSGAGYVFDAETFAELARFALGVPPTFINDVVVTKDAAYFTDSMQPAIFRVTIGPGGALDGVDVIDLDPAAIGFVPGAFNLNGIDATPDGQTLVVVNTTAGTLYTVDADTGRAREIDLGGASVRNGDGILLLGRTLYVVRNESNLVAVVKLSRDLSRGRVVDELRSDDFDVPTTVAAFGSSLYVVNARFGTMEEPPVEYWVTRLDR